MTRSDSKQAMPSHGLGAVPVVADALDADQVAAAVARARPDVIVHQLTAIPEALDTRHPDRAFQLTNRLRAPRWPRPGAYELVRKRMFPLVGDGGGVWSFTHVADAADATVAAVERGSRGIYNVVDDEPAAGRRVAAGAG